MNRRKYARSGLPTFGYIPASDHYQINHDLIGGNDLEIDTFVAELVIG